jgi:transposase
MLHHAQRASANVSHTCAILWVFNRSLFYIWQKRYEKDGLAGLRDQPRQPHRNRLRISGPRSFR